MIGKEMGFAGFDSYTLLETYGVPIWDFVGATRKQHDGCSGFTPLGRVMATGLALREGEYSRFWEVYSHSDNPLSRARIVEISADARSGETSSGSGILLDTSSDSPEYSRRPTWGQTADLADKCADLVVCDATFMYTEGNLRASASLRRMFAVLDRITDDHGICVLMYRHSTYDAWLAFAKALAMSAVWWYLATPPWIVPKLQSAHDIHDPSQSPWSEQTSTEWGALMVCRRRRLPVYDRQRSLHVTRPLIIDRSGLIRVTDKLRSVAGIFFFAGDVKLSLSDATNSWQASLVLEAVRCWWEDVADGLPLSTVLRTTPPLRRWEGDPPLP